MCGRDGGLWMGYFAGEKTMKRPLGYVPLLRLESNMEVRFCVEEWRATSLYCKYWGRAGQFVSVLLAENIEDTVFPSK